MNPVERICHLPAEFHRGDASMLQLVKDSGITPSQLTVEAVEPVVRTDPSVVDGWLRWSMDKRVSSGWYFKQEKNGYVVGFFPHGERIMFQDAAVACSEFVVREVKSMLSHVAL